MNESLVGKIAIFHALDSVDKHIVGLIIKQSKDTCLCKCWTTRQSVQSWQASWPTVYIEKYIVKQPINWLHKTEIWHV